jgi:ribosomal protein L11 methylase PrmA
MALNNIKNNYLVIDSLNKITENEKFDYILVNLLTDDIIDNFTSIIKLSKENSLFIISGIINFRLSEVLQEVQNNNLEIVEQKNKGIWNCLILKKNGLV